LVARTFLSIAEIPSKHSCFSILLEGISIMEYDVYEDGDIQKPKEKI
jgi:hypothetical protein